MLLATVCLTNSAAAGDSYWKYQISGYYTYAGNWTNGVPYGQGNSAHVDNGGIVIINSDVSAQDFLAGDSWRGYGSGTFFQSAGAATLYGWLRMGADSTGQGAVYSISGGSLSANQINAGEWSSGTVNIAGGAVTTNSGSGIGAVFVGGGNGGSGSGTLSVSAGSLTIGGDTSGNQSLIVGANASVGVVNLSGSGTISANSGDVKIGSQYGTATVNQTGGSAYFHLSSGGWTYIGGGTTTANYNLSGGLFYERNRVEIGQSNSGEFTQSGFSTAIIGGLYLGGDYGLHGNGTYNLDGGTLSVGSIQEATAGGSSTFNFNGGTLQPNYSNSNVMQGLTAANVRSGGAIIDTVGYDITISQPLQHSTVFGDNSYWDGGLTKTGAGTLTLNGTNSYVGVTTLNAGTLRLGSAGALGNGVMNTSAVTVNNGATLDLNGQTVSASMTVGGTGVGGNGAIINSNGVDAVMNGTVSNNGFTVGGAGNITLNAVNGSTLTKIGPGILTLGGTADNNSLGVVVNAGVVILNKASSTAPDVHAIGGNGVIVNNGGELVLSGSGGDQIYDAAPVAINSGGILDMNGRNELIGALSGSGTITNNLLISTSSLTVGAYNAGGTFGGVIQDGAGGAGTLALAKVGSGSLALTGANTYSGGTTISGGTLQIGNALALGSGGVTVNSGATLDLNAQTVANNLAIAGAGVGGAGAIINSSATAAAVNGTITNNGLTVGGAGNISLSTVSGGTVTKIGSGVLTLGGSADNNLLGLVVNSGTVILSKASSTNPDVHAIGGNGLTVNSGGLVELSNTGSDQIFDGAPVIVTDGGMFDANGRSESFATLTIAGSGIGGAGALANTAAGASVVTPSSGTILTGDTTIGVSQSAGSLTLNNPIGEIGGSRSLTKVGNGVLTLGGTNNYSGSTIVNAGTLVAANAAGSATGTGNLILNGGTLQSSANGAVGGSVLAGSGLHIIAPGGVGQIGTLNVGGLTTNSNTTLNFDLGSAMNSNGVYVGGDLLNVGNGGLTVGRGTRITFGTNPTATGYYRLIGGSIAGANLSSFVLPASPGGQQYQLSSTSDPGGYIDLMVGTPLTPASRSYTCPIPPPANTSDRLAQWDGTTWEPVTPGSLSGNVHVLVHGWAPVQRQWVDANGGSNARVWLDTNYFNNPNGSFFELANAIWTATKHDPVIAYSWIDKSATYTWSPTEAWISEWNTTDAGKTLADQLKTATGSHTANLQLIGHSHGARVVAVAAQNLQQSSFDHVRQLTLFDSPEDPEDPSKLLGAANRLGDVLKTLPIGLGPDKIFLDNYAASLLGGLYHDGNVINVALEPPAGSIASQHAYPIKWYTASGIASANTSLNPTQVGLDWSPLTLNLGQSLQSFQWHQNWNGDASQELKLNPEGPQLALTTVPMPVSNTTTLFTSPTISPIANGYDVKKGSPAFWDSTFTTDSTDVGIRFDYQFVQPGQGDQLAVWIDNQMRFVVTGQLVGTGRQTASFDIGDLPAGTHVMTVALQDYGTAPAEFTVSNFQFIAVPPQLNWTGQDGGNGAADSSWDTRGVSTNWAGGSTAGSYQDGAAVVFGDTSSITGGAIPNGAIVVQASGVAPASVTFNNGAVNYTVANAGGTIGITGGTGITMNGTGKVTLIGPNTFTGPVFINAGRLNIQNGAALGDSSGITVLPGAALELQGNIAVGAIPMSLTGIGVSGTGALNNVGGNNSFAGSITIGGSASIGSSEPGSTLTLTGTVTNSGTLTKVGNGALEIDAAPTLDDNSSLAVNGGKLKFNLTSGASSVGAGVAVTVAAGATLELAGSVSVLSTGSNRANVTNNSNVGLLVSGTNQQVGSIDGSGMTTVNDGGDLTADHIIQTALVIEGTMSSFATVTIRASRADGNATISAPSGLLGGDSAAAGSSFTADGASSGNSMMGVDPAAALTAVPPVGFATGARSSVPEPSSLLLAWLALIGLACTCRRLRERRVTASGRQSFTILRAVSPPCSPR